MDMHVTVSSLVKAATFTEPAEWQEEHVQVVVLPDDLAGRDLRVTVDFLGAGVPLTTGRT